MKCAYPGFYAKKFTFFPCGQCLACRINRKKTWILRMMNTLNCYDNSSFITLTYNEENVPYTDQGLRTLKRTDPVLFMKRLRKELSKYGIRIKFYGCAEYGGRTWRPHYHYIIYGVDFRQPYFYEILKKSWGKGNVDVGKQGVSRESIGYVAGYITKKMTSKNHPDLLGRIPEFSMLSKGIGINLVNDIVSDMLNFNKHILPTSITILDKSYPIGRYIKNKVISLLDALNWQIEDDIEIIKKTEELVVFCYEQALDKKSAENLLNGGGTYRSWLKFASPLIDQGALERIKKLNSIYKKKETI